jgi:hypothetical protein
LWAGCDEVAVDHRALVDVVGAARVSACSEVGGGGTGVLALVE